MKVSWDTMWAAIALAIMVTVAALLVTPPMFSGGGGIHPIGGEAVYLQGEACVVNTTTDRSLGEIEEDMAHCLKLVRENQF